MNILSGAFRYVAGSEDEGGARMSGEEIRKLVERIKNASLPSDRRAALKQLAAIAEHNPPTRALICEVGIKVFYAVLQQDRAYDANMQASLKLFYSLFTPPENNNANTTNDPNIPSDPAAAADDNNSAQHKQIAATNIDAFLGLPDALSLILELLSHNDYPIRALTLELVTAMAAYSRQTLQAALLAASAGVSKVCDCIDDGNPALKGNAIILLSMVAMESEEVGKIVAFSGVPDKLFDTIRNANPKVASIASMMPEDYSDAADSAAMVQDALELFSTLIECSPTTRTSLRELGFVARTVELLNSLIRDAGLVSPSSPVDFATHQQLWEQNSKNISLCCNNIKALVQGSSAEVRAVTAELAATDVFAALQALAFLPYVDSNINTNINDQHVAEPAMNIQTAQIRKAALSTISVLVRSAVPFRILFYTSLCASQITDAATPQINAVHTMLHDRSAALRTASYVALRESFVLDPNNRAPCAALLNAFTGSSNLTALVQSNMTSDGAVSISTPEMNDEDDEVTIPSKYLAILGEALKDALTLYPKGSDEAAVFYAAALLAWTLNRVQGARERLLAAFAHNAGNSLFPQIMRVLSAAQRTRAPSVMRIGLLSLVACWLYQSSAAVSAFLQSASHLPMIIEILQKGAGHDDKLDVHVKGLAAVVLGICFDVTEGESGAPSESGFLTGGKGPSMLVPIGTISDLIRNHIGISEFTARLEDLKATPQYAQPLTEEDAWKLAGAVENVEKMGVFFGGSSIGHEQYYDSDVVHVISNTYEIVAAKAMHLLPTNGNQSNRSENDAMDHLKTPYDASLTQNNNTDFLPSLQQGHQAPAGRTMEMLLADSAKDEVLNSYKEFIKTQEGSIERLESELRSAQGKISLLEKNSAGDTNAQYEGANGRIQKANVPSTNGNDGMFRFNGSVINSPGGTREEVDDLKARTRQLTEVVTKLEEELFEQRAQAQTLMDDLNQVQRNEEDWRRKALETEQAMQKQAKDNELSLAQVTQLNETIQQLRTEADSKGEDVNVVSRRMDELHGRCEELKDMRKRAEEEIAGLRKQIDARAEQNIELSGKLYEAEEKNTGLYEERVNMSAKIAQLEEELRMANTNAVAAAAANAGMDEEERANLTAKVQGLEAALRDANEKLALASAKEAEKNFGVHEERANMSMKLAELEEAMRVASANAEAEQVAAREKTVRLSEERNELAVKLAETENKLRAATIKLEEEANNAAAAAVEKEKKLAATYSQLEEANARAASAVAAEEKLRTENVKLEEAKAAAVAAAEKAAAATPKIVADPNVAQELDNVKNNLAFAEDQNKKLEASVRELRQLLEQQTTVNVGVSDELKKVKKEFDELTNTHNKLTSTYEEQSRDSVGLDSYQTLQEQLDEQQVLLDTTQNENAKLNASVRSLRVVEVQLKESSRKLQRELDEQKSKLKRADESRAKLLESVQVLEESVEEFKEKIESEQEESRAAKKQLTEALEEQEKTAQSLRETLKNKTGQLGEATAKLVCVSAALESTEEGNREANAKIEELEAEVEKFSDMRTQLEEARTELKTTQDTLATHMADRRSERTSKALENRVGTVESELENARQKLTIQKQHFESKIADLIQDVKNGQETVEATKRMYRESEKSAQSQALKAKAELGAIESELRSTKSELERKIKVIEEGERRKGEMEKGHEKKVDELNRRLEEVFKNIDGLTEEKDTLEEKVVENMKKLSEGRKERAAAAEEITRLQGAVVGWESAAQELERKLSREREARENLESKVENERIRYKKKEGEYTQLVDRLGKESDKLNILQNKYDELKALEAEHNELLVCLAELEMECNALKTSELGKS